ncbi:MAG: hypothetical protein PHQ74_15035 [Crocinitomicaceae bacterium]|nr:hypothetical protein [Crocinitomicaceae bacterium]
MKFFVKVTQTYATKNKLEAEISKMMNRIDSTLLDKKRLSTFISEIRNEISLLNMKHPRCSEKELIHWTTTNAECYRVENVGSFTAYQVQQEA